MLAAEGLVRAGDAQGLERLVEQARAFDWTASPHGPEQILEDLTGTFRGCPDDWETYLEARGAFEAPRLRA